MKPTPQMAEQYCSALMAWAQGKRVEWRLLDKHGDFGWIVAGEPPFPCFDGRMQVRIIDEPPKLRDVWISAVVLGKPGCVKEAYTVEQNTRNAMVKFREVTPAAEAEIADLRRNHDEMQVLRRMAVEAEQWARQVADRADVPGGIRKAAVVVAHRLSVAIGAKL